jgi:hypothetical protein
VSAKQCNVSCVLFVAFLSKGSRGCPLHHLPLSRLGSGRLGGTRFWDLARARSLLRASVFLPMSARIGLRCLRNLPSPIDGLRPNLNAAYLRCGFALISKSACEVDPEPANAYPSGSSEFALSLDLQNFFTRTHGEKLAVSLTKEIPLKRSQSQTSSKPASPQTRDDHSALSNSAAAH